MLIPKSITRAEDPQQLTPLHPSCGYARAYIARSTTGKPFWGFVNPQVPWGQLANLGREFFAQQSIKLPGLPDFFPLFGTGICLMLQWYLYVSMYSSPSFWCHVLENSWENVVIQEKSSQELDRVGWVGWKISWKNLENTLENWVCHRSFSYSNGRFLASTSLFGGVPYDASSLSAFAAGGGQIGASELQTSEDFDPQTSLVKLQKVGEHGNPYLVMTQKFMVILE